MKHKDIIKKIYEDNKDVLESEEQVERILNYAFMLFRSYVIKGKIFVYQNFFKVKNSQETYDIKRAKRWKENARLKLIMREKRSWYKKIMDDDFA